MTWTTIATREYVVTESVQARPPTLPRWRAVRNAPISVAGAQHMVDAGTANMATRRHREDIEPGKFWVFEELQFMRKGEAA